MSASVETWDRRWVQLATEIGSWSKDRAHQVGSVIVGSANQILSTGYNGFPRGVDDEVDERHERPAKYDWTEHAERNAINNAARFGVRIDGSDIYTSLFPCIACARSIIQVGIETVVTSEPNTEHPRWGREFILATEMLKESGVNIRLISG